MHALIIEQDTWIILMIEDALRALDYTSFDLAYSPQEAVIAARLRRPDLITADLRFGAGSGIDAVREIRASDAIPVVFVTATPWEVRAAEPDATVVAKPFCQAALQEGVARAVAAAPEAGRGGLAGPRGPGPAKAATPG